MAKAAIGFAFSGGGWLTTWYLGVLQGLIASGAFKPGLTPITGVSTGAQAAALGCAGGSPATALAGALVAAQKCLDTNLHPPCQYQLDAVLRGQLNQSMPSGAAAKCNGTLTLGFSAPYPLRGLGQYNEPRMGARRGFTTSNFTSDGDLEDGVAASGYLACLSDQKPYTTYKGKLALAGGYSYDFVCPKNVRRCVKIHSGVNGPLFAHYQGPPTAAAALAGNGSSSGGAAGGARRLRQAPPPQRGPLVMPTACPVSIGPPTITFNNKRPGVDIYPGKYNPVDVDWWTWEDWVLTAPNVAGLQYAYGLGVKDALSWAKENKLTA